VDFSDHEYEPFGSRHEVYGTVDDSVIEEINKVFEVEREEARADDRPEPTRSAVLEMLLRKGLKAYEQERNQRSLPRKV
jgi:hypothetical protein